MIKTRIAIFGVGRWGIHLIRNFSEHPQSEIIAVVDPHPERLTEVQNRFNLGPNVVFTTNDAQVWNLPQLDVVVIATPAITHYALIKTALEKGYHVFAEKPLTLNLSEARQLCELAQEQNRHLFVDHTYLFHPAIQQAKTLIYQGILGRLRYGYAARTHLEPIRQDVDVLWDLAIHDLVIFNTWLGQIPVEVQASGRVWLPHQPSYIASSPPRYDLVMATLTYAEGFQAFLHFCWINPDKQRRLSLVGTEGTLIFDELSTVSPLVWKPGSVSFQDQDWCATHPQPVEISIEKIEPLKQACDHFLGCILTNTLSIISPGQIGVELMKVLLALSQSLEQGGVPVPV